MKRYISLYEGIDIIHYYNSNKEVYSMDESDSKKRTCIGSYNSNQSCLSEDEAIS